MLIGNPAIRVWLGVSPILPSLAVRPPRLTVPTPRFTVSSATSSATGSRVTTPTGTESDSASPTSPSTPASSIHDDDFAKQNFVSQSAFYTPSSTWYPASKALAYTNTTPLLLASKEHLGILNGTAFSAGLAALVVNGAKDVAVLGAVSGIGGSLVGALAHSFTGLDRDVHRSHVGFSRLF